MDVKAIKIVLVTAALLLLFAAAAHAEEKCLTCHEGIEKITNTPVMSSLSCTDCHKGNANATTQEEAHKGMYANPSDYRVVEETCGKCHMDIVKKSKKSLHATMAGLISGARYSWGAQDTKNAIYATYDVVDDDGDVPTEKGAVKSLKQLPTYDPSKPMSNENHPVDDYLRNQCLRCHLWSSGHERDGDYRASGCAACHVIYDDDGTYKGGDKAIPKDQKDRPREHRITTKIPEFQCIHCHNRGGRTGVSFIGTMEADPYGYPWSGEAGKKGAKKLHGKYYNHLTKDVHYEKGMTCIDCHTEQDLHGDGNIYSKREQAVEIECEDCHGTPWKESELKTSWGNPMKNLKKVGDKVILVAKLTGKEHEVPQLKQLKDKNAWSSEEAKVAMEAIPKHIEKLECYACHARWAPQCYGCHAQQNLAKRSSDWINTKETEDPSKAGTKANRGNTAFEWKETRSYLRWESPTLGINSEGKVSPFIPGCQVFFTQVDENGTARVLNKVFTTYDGFSGIMHNPIQPHTVSKEARTCEDCHANRKALGLGSGYYDPKASGLPIDFELERIVDENGNQIQATSHYGARPFNKEEMERISRVGSCIGCHKSASDPVWKDVKKIAGVAENPEAHITAISTLFTSAVEGKKAEAISPKPAEEAKPTEEAKSTEAKGVCGPTAIAALATLPLALRRALRRRK